MDALGAEVRQQRAALDFEAQRELRKADVYQRGPDSPDRRRRLTNRRVDSVWVWRAREVCSSSELTTRRLRVLT